jgi:hypothetical protein
VVVAGPQAVGLLVLQALQQRGPTEALLIGVLLAALVVLAVQPLLLVV